jgi:hypothetical protein
MAAVSTSIESSAGGV